MKDVLLINPSTGTEKYSYINPPLNLLCLAAYIEDEYLVQVVDIAQEDNFENVIKKYSKNALCVGISAMTGKQITNWSDNLKNDQRF